MARIIAYPVKPDNALGLRFPICSDYSKRIMARGILACFATQDHVERKWKEARLFRTAPISNNLVLAQVAQHGLGMPRSY